MVSHQQRAGHQDPHRWRGRTQRLVRRDVRQSLSAIRPASADLGFLRSHRWFHCSNWAGSPSGHLRATQQLPHRAHQLRVAHICLPYNAILGYPALAKFMAVTHHGYNVLKMPGSSGVITVPCEERDAVCSLERAFQAATIKDPDHGSGRPPEATPKKKKVSPSPSHQEAGASGGVGSGSAPNQGAPPSLA